MLSWGAHESCRALAQRLPNHSCLQRLEAHIVQRDPKGQELRLVGAQQVVVGLQGEGSVRRERPTPRQTPAQAPAALEATGGWQWKPAQRAFTAARSRPHLVMGAFMYMNSSNSHWEMLSSFLFQRWGN